MNPLGFSFVSPAPQPAIGAEAILGMERHQTMLREFDRLREADQNRHVSLLQYVGGIEEALRERNQVLRGARDSNQAGADGGITSSLALDVFKTLDNDKDGTVTRAELDRYLGLA
ncbi:MAG: hypothetical protein FJY99_00520 [Candidatus Sericytochromatia bacterium]|nr:hypothetical protein [Candidatus Tanganyikabacteria bacterium]